MIAYLVLQPHFYISWRGCPQQVLSWRNLSIGEATLIPGLTKLLRFACCFYLPHQPDSFGTVVMKNTVKASQRYVEVCQWKYRIAFCKLMYLSVVRHGHVMHGIFSCRWTKGDQMHHIRTQLNRSKGILGEPWMCCQQWNGEEYGITSLSLFLFFETYFGCW